MKREIFMMTAGILVGAALSGGGNADAAGVIAERSTQPIFVNGKQATITAYNIYGNNYVRLRDIGQAVGFNVYWDNGVQIDSNANYTGEPPAQKIQTQDTTDACTEIISLTNDLRRENGIAPLSKSDLLMQAAQVRADEMAMTSTYSHVRPDGSKYYTVTDCPYMAENINRIANLYLEQQHKTLAEATVESWSNSQGHRDNMLNSRLTEIGIGLAQGVNATGQPAWYCVQFFLYDGYEITWVDEMQTR